MKKKYYLFIVLLNLSLVFVAQEDHRIDKLKIQLDSLSTSISGLTKKVNFSLNDTELPVFIRAIAKENKLNVNIAPELSQFRLSQNFSNETVKMVLLYLCKEYNLKIEVLGSILSIKKYQKPYKPRDIKAFYDKEKDLFSVDLQKDTLSVAFKKITNATGKNLVYTFAIENLKISSYIKEKSFESAMDKIAFANNLSVIKTKDNFYLFDSASDLNPKGITDKKRQKPARRRNSNFYFQVKDSLKQIIDVDFQNESIASIIDDIGLDLGINSFTSSPLSKAGNATVKANAITYDVLLTKILENTKFSFKKIDNIYYFGEDKQQSLVSSVVIPLLHRSIEIMDTPIQNARNSGFNSSSMGANNSYLANQNYGVSNNYNQNVQGQQYGNNLNNRNTFQDFSNQSSAILELIPKNIKQDLDITTDLEQNAFLVNGNAQKIEDFKKFLKTIDKPIPVILIEVMIIEVSNSTSLSTGLELGIGDEPISDGGQVFPGTGSDATLNLGAASINKIIGGFNNFGALNVGKVVPNFYARIQALETNGDLKIRSTPKLSTLNGHQATLSRGKRSYYAVTQTNTIGTQNPVITDIKNYYPIDADLSIGIKPLVSGDGNITLSINVVQSDFNGEQIDPEAPPGMDSREFTSTIRVKDKDVIILGGIEETSKVNSGSGVPFLARIPLIKYLFSKRVRTASKSKLSVLIKPTIIY